MLSVSVYEKYSAGSLSSAVLGESARMRKVLYIAIKSVPSKVLLVECDYRSALSAKCYERYSFGSLC